MNKELLCMKPVPGWLSPERLFKAGKSLGDLSLFIGEPHTTMQ